MFFAYFWVVELNSSEHGTTATNERGLLSPVPIPVLMPTEAAVWVHKQHILSALESVPLRCSVWNSNRVNDLDKSLVNWERFLPLQVLVELRKPALICTLTAFHISCPVPWSPTVEQRTSSVWPNLGELWRFAKCWAVLSSRFLDFNGFNQWRLWPLCNWFHDVSNGQALCTHNHEYLLLTEEWLAGGTPLLRTVAVAAMTLCHCMCWLHPWTAFTIAVVIRHFMWRVAFLPAVHNPHPDAFHRTQQLLLRHNVGRTVASWMTWM